MENQELTSQKPKKFKYILVVVILAVLLSIIFYFVSKNNKSPLPINKPSGQENVVGSGSLDGTIVNDIPYNATNTMIAGAKVIVPGANAISPTNDVITVSGVKTDNAAAPMSENAPKQTDFLVKENLSNLVWKITIGYGMFAPKEFTVNASLPLTFSLTSTDEYSHFITFDDPSLSAIKIFVGPRQTKAITFNAPKNAGVYTFSCGIPGHAGKGEVGKMIVK